MTQSARQPHRQPHRRADPQPAFVIRHGIPAHLRAEAVELYWQAFGPKLNKVLGPHPRARAFLTRVMRTDNAFAAVDDHGRLLGIAGYRTPEGSFAGGTLADLRAIYGRAGAKWRAALLLRLAHAVDERHFLVDGVSVRAPMRGCGIGSALIDALCTEGRAQGFSIARLEVVDSNLRARALYERLGFTAIGSQPIGLLRHVFGFHAATSMIRPLNG